MGRPCGWIVISVQLAYISIYLHILNMLNGVIQDGHLNNRCVGCGGAQIEPFPFLLFSFFMLKDLWEQRSVTLILKSVWCQSSASLCFFISLFLTIFLLIIPHSHSSSSQRGVKVSHRPRSRLVGQWHSYKIGSHSLDVLCLRGRYLNTYTCVRIMFTRCEDPPPTPAQHAIFISASALFHPERAKHSRITVTTCPYIQLMNQKHMMHSLDGRENTHQTPNHPLQTKLYTHTQLTPATTPTDPCSNSTKRVMLTVQNSHL